MPTAQELKRAREELDTQIAAAEQEECEAKEEAHMAAEKAWLEEEACERELTFEEARARAEEEAQKQEEEWHARKEEEHLVVERDLCEEGGPSWERAQRRRLFLPSLSDSTRSPEEEEGMEVRVEGPSWDKGKGWAPVSEEARGEVTGVVCDLCDKNGIPCRWGKVSDDQFFLFFFLFIDLPLQKTAHVCLPGLPTSLGKMPCRKSEARCGFTLRKVPLVCMQRSSCRRYVTHLFEGRDFS